MQLRWGRLLLGLVIAELVPTLILVALVAAYGPSTEAEAQAYATRLGRWVGPVADCYPVPQPCPRLPQTHRYST